MTMTKDYLADQTKAAFWLTHPDPTQAAVHLALQWVAFVYPASELQIDRTLKHALPYADADLSSRWSQFLDENDVEDHVEALGWVKETLSTEQIPFLVETCWRLLLVDHELPTHVPLALRILGQVLDISEQRIHDLGESVYREFVDEDDHRNRAPLLPVDPRYLDRVEWRLYGHSATQRLNINSTVKSKERSIAGYVGFLLGTGFGVLATVALVFGPLQLGRVKVPILLHDGMLFEESAATPIPSLSTPIATEGVDSIAVQEVESEIQTQPEDLAPATVVDEQVIEEAQQSVAAETLEQAPDSAQSVLSEERVLMEVSASILNVRSAPTVDSDVIIKLATGARVWAYPGQATGLWMLVKVEGETGYASARFLSEVNN